MLAGLRLESHGSPLCGPFIKVRSFTEDFGSDGSSRANRQSHATNLAALPRTRWRRHRLPIGFGGAGLVGGLVDQAAATPIGFLPCQTSSCGWMVLQSSSSGPRMLGSSPRSEMNLSKYSFGPVILWRFSRRDTWRMSRERSFSVISNAPASSRICRGSSSWRATKVRTGCGNARNRASCYETFARKAAVETGSFFLQRCR